MTAHMPPRELTNYSSQFREFAKFETEGDAEREKPLEAAAAFANDFANGKDPYSLTLLGASGIGKTHLARALKRWAVRYMYVIPAQWPLISYFTAAGSAKRYFDGEYDLTEYMKKVDFLVIDDIGTERDPKLTFRSELQAVLDRRLGLWTVITSNLSYSQLADYDARLASRTLRNGGRVVHSRATDWNLTKLQKGK